MIADAVRIVGAIQGSNTQGTYKVHNEHLGAVVKVTDQDQEIVWDADRLPFGALDILTEQITIPLRSAKPRIRLPTTPLRARIAARVQRTLRPKVARNSGCRSASPKTKVATY